MKKILYVFPVFILLISVFIIFKPFKPKEKIIYIAPQPTPTINTSLPSGSGKIEEFVFHATQRCISCINIGKYTKATIEEKFPQELKSGKITFKEINIDLTENQKLAKDYGVSGSSLYITTTKEGQISNEEDTTVWRLVTNEAQIKSYLEAKLRKLL